MTVNFDSVIKREKRKQRLVTSGILLVAVVLILGVGVTAVKQRMASQYRAAQKVAMITDMIESPNVTSTSHYLAESGLFNRRLKSDRFKNIDGYLVKTAPLEINFSLFSVGYGGGTQLPITVPISKTKTIGAFNRENGEKLPLFFNPKHEAIKKANEADTTHESQTLADLQKHVAEVAISFKEPMTYAEIQAKIPDNLLINWYWLGMASNKLSVTDTIGKVIGINANEIGQLTDTPGKSGRATDWTRHNYPDFVAAVKKAAATRKFNSSGIDIYQDALQQIKTYPTLKQAKFSGIIVSGRTENLAQLDSQAYIYATNIGLDAEILPYIAPTK